MNGRYPPGAIFRDYVCGGLGILVCTAPLVLMQLPQLTAVICLLLAALFARYLWQTGRRQRTRIGMDSRAIRDHANGLCIDWQEISCVSLRYFSVRRDGEAGWFELTLTGKGRHLKLDSRLVGFTEVARHAAEAAVNNRLAVDAATRSNFEAMKISNL